MTFQTQHCLSNEKHISVFVLNREAIRLCARMSAFLELAVINKAVLSKVNMHRIFPGNSLSLSKYTEKRLND